MGEDRRGRKRVEKGWEEGWKRVGRGLEEGWKRVGRGLEEGWKRIGMVEKVERSLDDNKKWEVRRKTLNKQLSTDY